MFINEGSHSRPSRRDFLATIMSVVASTAMPLDSLVERGIRQLQSATTENIKELGEIFCQLARSSEPLGVSECFESLVISYMEELPRLSPRAFIESNEPRRYEGGVLDQYQQIYETFLSHPIIEALDHQRTSDSLLAFNLLAERLVAQDSQRLSTAENILLKLKELAPELFDGRPKEMCTGDMPLEWRVPLGEMFMNNDISNQRNAISQLSEYLTSFRSGSLKEFILRNKCSPESRKQILEAAGNSYRPSSGDDFTTEEFSAELREYIKRDGLPILRHCTPELYMYSIQLKPVRVCSSGDGMPDEYLWIDDDFEERGLRSSVLTHDIEIIARAADPKVQTFYSRPRAHPLLNEEKGSRLVQVFVIEPCGELERTLDSLVT